MGKTGSAENLSQYADALGEIRAQKAILETKEKEISNYIKMHGKVGTTIHGKNFDCDLIQGTSRVIDAVKAFKKLGKDKFLKAASITITAAKRFMSDEEIDEVSDTKDGALVARTKARIVVPQGLDSLGLGGEENIEL
jgi:hypothetical protein